MRRIEWQIACGNCSCARKLWVAPPISFRFLICSFEKVPLNYGFLVEVFRIIQGSGSSLSWPSWTGGAKRWNPFLVLSGEWGDKGPMSSTKVALA